MTKHGIVKAVFGRKAVHCHALLFFESMLRSSGFKRRGKGHVEIVYLV